MDSLLRMLKTGYDVMKSNNGGMLKKTEKQFSSGYQRDSF